MHTDEHILEYAGAFRLVRKIAQGGMATVYEAEQLGPAGFAKRVALKVINRGAADPLTLLRFLEEAKVTARLDHPHIVRAFHVGQDEGLVFIALELLEGGTLAARLGRPLDPGRAAELVEKLARAAGYAHENGILHRDLKPANVLFTATGPAA